MTLSRQGVRTFRYRGPIAIGQVLVCVDADGLMTPDDVIPSGHWEPVTNGDPDSPEIVFSDGDVAMTFVED